MLSQSGSFQRSHATWKVLDGPGNVFVKFPGPAKSWRMSLVLEITGNLSAMTSNSILIWNPDFRQVRNQTDLQTRLRRIWIYRSLHKALIRLIQADFSCPHHNPSMCLFVSLSCRLSVYRLSLCLSVHLPVC